MKYLKLFFLILLVSASELASAQSEEADLKLSLQTDLLAYTTLGGWSAWATAEYRQTRLTLAFVQYPNRFRNVYEETGIKETPSWLRIQLSRDFKPTSKFKNFHYGLNIEHHWRKLEEDGNPDEVLNDTHWEIGLFAGYIWRPWTEKDNALKNVFFTFWGGGNYLPTNTEMARVFENTGSIYNIPALARPTVGINVGYTFYQN